ncbi:hypothetical protein Tco_0667919 [Tanacetum coccineum]
MMASLFIGNLTKMWEAVMEVMEGPSNSVGGAVKWASELRRRNFQRASKLREKGHSKGPSNSGGGAFEGASELRRMVHRRRRRLHPLGEYVITLYTNGKLHTRVTVTLISGAEEAMLHNLLDGDSYLLYEQSRSSVSVSKEILFDNFSRGLQRLMSTYVMLHSHIYKYGALHVSSFLYNRVLVLPQRLQATVKAATEVAGCCEGCTIGCRLLQRLQATVKAATEVAVKAATELDGCCEAAKYVGGCYEGCHIGCRLLQRLHAAVKAETKAAVKAVTEAVVNAATKVAGCCKGYHITMKGATLLRRLQASNVAKKAVTLLRRLHHC